LIAILIALLIVLLRRRKATKSRPEISAPGTPQAQGQFPGHLYTSSNAGTISTYNFYTYYGGSEHGTPQPQREVHELDGSKPIRELEAIEMRSQLELSSESEVKS